MEENLIYSRNVIDLVTICTEYCRALEQAAGVSRSDFIDRMCTLLPMVYLKMTLLDDVPHPVVGYNEGVVTEADYDFVWSNVRTIMSDMDDFLDVFVSDFKYSEEPLPCTVSESLADVYQPLRNFVQVFRDGNEEAMHVALYDVQEEFRLTWGQKLLGALRALHASRFGT